MAPAWRNLDHVKKKPSYNLTVAVMLVITQSYEELDNIPACFPVSDSLPVSLPGIRALHLLMTVSPRPEETAVSSATSRHVCLRLAGSENILTVKSGWDGRDWFGWRNVSVIRPLPVKTLFFFGGGGGNDVLFLEKKKNVFVNYLEQMCFRRWNLNALYPKPFLLIDDFLYNWIWKAHLTAFNL